MILNRSFLSVQRIYGHRRSEGLAAEVIDNLIKAAKANPGKMSVGISGVGGQPWVTSMLLKKYEGVAFQFGGVRWRWSRSPRCWVKQLDVSGLAVGAAVQYIKNGDLRALAIMKNSPNPALPDVPHITQVESRIHRRNESIWFLLWCFREERNANP